MAKIGELIATRDGFGDEIVEIGRENKDVYVVDVDIGKSCKTGKFSKALRSSTSTSASPSRTAPPSPPASPPPARSPS